MHSDETFNFLQWALPATQSVLTAALWIMIYMRVKGIMAANRHFHSHWKTASAVLIVISGLLVTLYVLCMITVSIQVGITWNIASKKNIPSDRLTVDDFTPNEVRKIIKIREQESALLVAARFFLSFSLWTSKLAFLCFFLGNHEYLVNKKRLVLYAASGLTLLCFVVVVVTYGLQLGLISPSIPQSPVDQFTVDEYWTGGSFVWFTAWIEYTCASLGLAQEIYVTAMACYIIRSMPRSSNSIYILLIFLGINIATSCFILIAYSILQYAATGGAFNIEAATILAPTLVFMMDFNVILSIILSCVPGAKAWFFGAWRKRKPPPGSAPPDPSHPTKPQEALQLFDVEGDVETSGK